MVGGVKHDVDINHKIQDFLQINVRAIIISLRASHFFSILLWLTAWRLEWAGIQSLEVL